MTKEDLEWIKTTSKRFIDAGYTIKKTGRRVNGELYITLNPIGLSESEERKIEVESACG